ncbi:MAG: MBL fold metallo-hydrolase [Pseudomonadota bacterium]|nr:MBL fold metallo-hydrolase [Pseudomonadota bacterium]
MEVRCGEHLIILDAGSGMRDLGNRLRSQAPVRADILMSHVHYDHILGFPFFQPFFNPQNTFRIWGGLYADGIRAAFEQFLRPPLFPVSLDVMRSTLRFCDFVVGETFALADDVTVRTAPLNHPNAATAYRIDYNGGSVCYVTDTEHRPDGPDAAILELIQGAEVMIYDATYTDDEYPLRRGWGHSTWQEGMRLCELADVRTLIAFHHEPEHDDAFLDRVAAAIAERRPGSLVAREGLTLRVNRSAVDEIARPRRRG